VEVSCSALTGLKDIDQRLTHVHPYCWCPRCGQSIHFPYPTHQEQAANPLPMPTGTWKAQILCTACGQLWLCTARSLRLGFAQTRGRDRVGTDVGSFFEIVYECGEGGCVSRIRTFVHTTLYSTTQSAHEKLKTALTHPICEHGHLLSDASKFVVAREVFSLW
jgi:hypothetical protein